MTTPQDPPRRNKLKRRRTKKLAEWRAKQPEKTEAGADAGLPVVKVTAAEAAAATAAANASKSATPT